MNKLSRCFSYCRSLWSGPQQRQHALWRLRLALRGVDLGYVTREELKLSTESCWHVSAGGPDLERVLTATGLPREQAAIDLGCGKGGALITLSRYFAIADGVEISPALCEVARRNLQRLKITNSSIVACDAAAFTALDQYQVLYMFNPFSAPVVEQVLGNLAQSQARCPRSLTAIYVNPIGHEVFLRHGFRKQSEFMVLSHQCNLYVREEARRGTAPKVEAVPTRQADIV